jgi:heme-degrading monooxygenase HmoA
MYVVLFQARLGELDTDYETLAAQLRERAFEEFGCLDFVVMTEGDREIAISYWKSLDDIKAWKADLLHQKAQATGRKRWYRSYKVEVLERIRGREFQREEA